MLALFGEANLWTTAAVASGTALWLWSGRGRQPRKKPSHSTGRRGPLRRGRPPVLPAEESLSSGRPNAISEDYNTFLPAVSEAEERT
ncbi:MAG: hypothetical protein ACM3XM_18380, partial [Mycobacterium leprae]